MSTFIFFIEYYIVMLPLEPGRVCYTTVVVLHL